MASQQSSTPNGVYSLKPKQTHDEAAYECYKRYCAGIRVPAATYAAWLKLTTRISAVNWLAKGDNEGRKSRGILPAAHRGQHYKADLAYATA
jgi:hypothetical protein